MSLGGRVEIRTGLERCLQQAPDELERGARFGLLMNQASVTSNWEYACDVLAKRFPKQLAAIFSPQHGLWCEQQANMIESSDSFHPTHHVPVYSLYSQTREPTVSMLRGIDLLLVDLQDVGTRVYTFIWTVVNCLRVCAAHRIPVVILDRPNPIGGVQVEGPKLESSFRSFVGLADIPMRHAMTIGELAQFCNAALGIEADVRVIPMSGWQREFYLEDTTAPWCPPSPNMPRLETALLYPGQVLLEGTNLSEGRGTTTPFEVVGAPFIDGYQLANELNALELPGVWFRPIKFVPTFDKWKGESCGGVFFHVSSKRTVNAYRATVEVLAAVRRLYGDKLVWLAPPYEYEYEKLPIDILSGSTQLREAVDRGDEAALRSACRLDEDLWQSETAAFRIY